MSAFDDTRSTDRPDDPGVPPHDELDALLRAWHAAQAARASELREQLIDRVMAERAGVPAEPTASSSVQTLGQRTATQRSLIGRLIMNRYSPIAAVLVAAAVLVPFLVPTARQATYASDVIQVPEGGKLDAFDAEGNVIGPCPLKHTDVDAQVSGHFTRVTIKQQYRNPYDTKIEAVYTFPLSHRSAVDRMTMTVGDRVVIGEVKERQKARAMYEAAREQGYVASLLEQERPNIFTQSVANIEPGAEIAIEISYVETLESKDGTYSFDFPMVVGPRYIPGSQRTAATALPNGLTARQGVVLLGPAKATLGEEGETKELGTLQTGKLQALLHAARPIAAPGAEWWTTGSSTRPAGAERESGRVGEGESGRGGDGASDANRDAATDTNRKSKIGIRQSEVSDSRSQISNSESQISNSKSQIPDSPAELRSPALWYRFEVVYCSGAKELGTLHTDGTGQLNGRWFYTDRGVIKDTGTGFAPDTTQVPDASRVTPEPVKPGKRTGHDISVRVTIDTGGPGLLDITAAQHSIIRTKELKREDGLPRRTTVELRREVEIPNRDFVLSWKQTADTIQEATFTHTGKPGNFVTLILQPPARVEEAQAVARELVFVLDTSGSMNGQPIEKAKAVMAKAIDALRPQDTFNLITFSGDTHILWDKPRPFTESNRKEAQEFLAARQGRGGTEMMKAVNAALVQGPEVQKGVLTPDELANLAADGRSVRVELKPGQLRRSRPSDGNREWAVIKLDDGNTLAVWSEQVDVPENAAIVVTGNWATAKGRRVLNVTAVNPVDAAAAAGPIRVVCFMTDGYVGNDMAIVDAVKKNAATTRVFSFGIGNSVNRYLLDGMARAGRGEVEYVLLGSDADEAVKRFAQRIQTPVLTDIEVRFDGVKVTELTPGVLPDLFDVKPLVLHGRYGEAGKGKVTIRGRTAAGRYERTLDLELPASQPEHDTIATLWARAKVEDLMNQDLAAAQQGNFPPELKNEVVRLGETFGIMTQFTSFVAIEKSRVTIGGQPKLVAVPIEMPQGVSYEGVFGEAGGGGSGALTGARFVGGDALTAAVWSDRYGLPAEAMYFDSGGAYGRRSGPARQALSLGAEGEARNRLLERQRSTPTAQSNFPNPNAWRQIQPAGKAVPGSPLPAVTVAPATARPGRPSAAKAAPAQPPAPSTTARMAQIPALHPSNAIDVPAMHEGSIALAGDPSDLTVLQALIQRLDDAQSSSQESSESQPEHGVQMQLVDKAVALLNRVKTANAVDWARQVLLFERSVVLIDALTQADKPDEARKVADALVQVAPEFKLGASIQKTLADDKLNASTRKARVSEIAAQSRKAIAAAEREAKLRHRLDERLHRWVTGKPDAPAPEGFVQQDGAVLVSVLLRATDDATLEQARKAGLSVQGVVASAKFVVGTAPREKIADLALLDAVRKIEPTQPEPASR